MYTYKSPTVYDKLSLGQTIPTSLKILNCNLNEAILSTFFNNYFH